MSNVFCVKLKKEGTQMNFQPFPGDLGKKIYENICQESWSKWVDHQTILINEYRLSMLDDEAKTFLKNEMQKFLFQDNENKPDQFTTQE